MRVRQLAGLACGICRTKITAEADGCWCAACDTTFHAACMARTAGICPCCRRLRDRPERYFVFAQVCPQCLHEHEAPVATCARCGRSTTFADDASHRDKRRALRRLGRGNVAAGVAMLLAGVGAFVMPVLFPVVAAVWPNRVVFQCAFGFLSILGAWDRIAVGRRMLRFR